MSVVLPSEYPLVMLACVILTIECFMLGPTVVGPARFRVFNKEFMAQFEEEHEKAFGKDGVKPAVGGFPDCGDGRYCEKLGYKDWVDFNNAMRVHQNFVESLPKMVVILLIAGLYLPLFALIVGWLNCGTKLIYIVMYVTMGSDARKLGAIAGSLPLYLLALATFGVMLYQVFQDDDQISLKS